MLKRFSDTSNNISCLNCQGWLLNRQLYCQPLADCSVGRLWSRKVNPSSCVVPRSILSASEHTEVNFGQRDLTALAKL